MTVKESVNRSHTSPKMGRRIDESVTFTSGLYHFFNFRLRKQKTELENGMLIISVDVDVGSRELGVINGGKNDANVNKHFTEYSIGKIEEGAIPLFVDLLSDFELPVTFAIRGQLTEINDSSLRVLLKSSVKHDIGAHGYYHKEFQNLSRLEAENELNLISVGMNKFGVTPKSFCFPRNSVAHLDLLAKYGYKCYRSNGNFMNDCMYIEKGSSLFDVHPTLYLGQPRSPIMLEKILDVSITKRAPFHLWFHLWNLGDTEETMQKTIEKVLFPLFMHAKKKEREGVLTFETMLSATQKIEEAFVTNS